MFDTLVLRWLTTYIFFFCCSEPCWHKIELIQSCHVTTDQKNPYLYWHRKLHFQKVIFILLNEKFWFLPITTTYFTSTYITSFPQWRFGFTVVLWVWFDSYLVRGEQRGRRQTLKLQPRSGKQFRLLLGNVEREGWMQSTNSRLMTVAVCCDPWGRSSHVCDWDCLQVCYQAQVNPLSWLVLCWRSEHKDSHSASCCERRPVWTTLR